MTDNNIDTRTALYWCLFCRDSSSKPSLVNEGTLHRQVFPDPELKNAYDKADRMTDAQKAAESVIEELKDSNSSRLSNEFKYIIGKMDSREAAAVGSKLIADLDAHEDKTASCFARELGETFAHPEKIMPDGSKLPVVDVGSNLAKSIAGVKQLSSGKDKGWLSRTWDVVKGYWHSITDAVSEWFWGGKWEDASLLEKLNMLKTGGVHALQLVAIAYIVYKIRGWLFPQLKLAWKNLMSGDALAKCTFDDTDGNSYMCWFDKDTMTWQVKHNRGVKALVHSDDVFMTKEEADQFFSTGFFKKFCGQCERYISPYLDEIRSSQQLENSSTPSDVKSMLQFILSKGDEIRDRMFNGTYSYFNESEHA